MDNVSYALCVIIKVIIHIPILQLAVCNLLQTTMLCLNLQWMNMLDLSFDQLKELISMYCQN